MIGAVILGCFLAATIVLGASWRVEGRAAMRSATKQAKRANDAAADLAYANELNRALERRCVDLVTTNNILSKLNERLAEDNATLRSELDERAEPLPLVRQQAAVDFSDLTHVDLPLRGGF